LTVLDIQASQILFENFDSIHKMCSGVNRCIKQLLEEVKMHMPINNDAMVHFLTALVKTKSLPGHEKSAIELVAKEMSSLGYDSVAIDEYGNLSGVIWV